MNAHDIPEEFINYFDGLSDARKAAIIESRPDLADGLGYKASMEAEAANDSLALEHEEQVEIPDVEEFFEPEEYDPEELEDDEISDEIPESEDISVTMPKNIYDRVRISDYFENALEPFQAFTVSDGQVSCKIHRKPFKNVHFKYRQNGSVYGVSAFYCTECNRLYLQEYQKFVAEELSKRGIDTKVYPLDVSNAFIRSQLGEIELGEGEKVYIPDEWIEEKPICPIHGERLEAYPYVVADGDVKVPFTGYYCENCGKVMLRKTKAIDLESDCAMQGVIAPEFEKISENKPKKIVYSSKDIKPDYYIDNGKASKFIYKNSREFYRLSEEDTVVVSDSVYCPLEDHETEEVEIVMMVQGKRNGRNAYLCAAGYCSQCQKYYLSEDDYKVIYGIGRPEVAIIMDVEEESYQITSGEVFDLEKDHLAVLEDDLERNVNDILNASDYVNPYATGDYDDGQLRYSKFVSNHTYGKKLESLNEYKDKPYSYRVDITFAGKTETYYLGADDIELDGEKRVVSYNSNFGKKLVNYRTLNLIKDGKQYDVKLSRSFDLENAKLFGYVNLRTDEDMIFRAGITDPFLVKVLNVRKKQHNLVDIIATIQENQNAIVDEHMSQNIIVQGCAGSGKTMVLLHRLSSLKYNHPEFDFSTAVILTPNEQFNLHINGLAASLQIGNITRISVEQYYLDILKTYSYEFIPNSKTIASEIYVKQSYVDYIYSDEFKDKFNIAYDEVISNRGELAEMLKTVCEYFAEAYSDPSSETDSSFIPSIKVRTDRFERKIEAKKKELADLEETMGQLAEKNASLDERIPKLEELANSSVKNAVPEINTKISKFIAESKQIIDEQEKLLGEIEQNQEKVQRQLLPFGKQAKLDELKKQHTAVVRRRNGEQRKLEEATRIFDFDAQDKSDDEILSWMRGVSLYIESVKDNIRFCERPKKELPLVLADKEDVTKQIQECQEKMDACRKDQYSVDAERAVAYLKAKAEEYSAINTFNNIFENATREYRESNNVKVARGLHRYDLYAQILFCMRFFNKTVGTLKYICVDEAQDMSFNEYKMIYDVNNKDVIFNIFGDTNQLLKPGRGISNWSDLKDYFHMKEFSLNENYRNTNQITRFCNNSFGMNVYQTGVDGAKVKEIARRDLEKELSELKLGDERVAILVPRRVKKSGYLETSILPSEIRRAIGNKIENGAISLMYVDEVKGIEFDRVYVVPNKMTKNEKYIAYTRALSNLIVVVDENVDKSTKESA
jgi:DNA helicase IV